MRLWRAFVRASALSLCATAVQAGPWQIGPSIGMSLVRSSGSSTTVVSAPAGSEFLLAGVSPGLRIGSWDSRLQNEWFLDTSLQLIAYENSTISATTNTLNFAHAFGARSAPYITFGAGFSRVAVDGDSQTGALYGAGLGVRERLRHGHGSIRTELRLDRLDPNERFADSVTIVGVHVGFDLDLD